MVFWGNTSIRSDGLGYSKRLYVYIKPHAEVITSCQTIFRFLKKLMNKSVKSWQTFYTFYWLHGCVYQNVGNFTIPHIVLFFHFDSDMAFHTFLIFLKKPLQKCLLVLTQQKHLRQRFCLLENILLESSLQCNCLCQCLYDISGGAH